MAAPGREHIKCIVGLWAAIEQGKGWGNFPYTLFWGSNKKGKSSRAKSPQRGSEEKPSLE